MIDPFAMRSHANAAARFIVRQGVSLLVVAMANFGAQSADAKPADSVEEDGLVDRTVRQCKCCKPKRQGVGLPRMLVRLPLEVVMSSVFHRKAPIEICSYCDGDALNAALKAHERRKSNS